MVLNGNGPMLRVIYRNGVKGVFKGGMDGLIEIKN
jgi:hypothetical protein